VTRWLSRQLAPITAASIGVAVVMDPDGLLDSAELSGRVELVDDWWCLRGSYERHGRRRDPGDGLLVLLVRGPLAAEALPWDIERAAVATVTVRLPGPPEVRSVLRELDGDELDRAITEVSSTANDPGAAVLRAVTGVDVEPSAAPLAGQLRIAARIATRPHRSPALTELARRCVTDPAFSPLLDEPPTSEPLQRIWAGFIQGDRGTWSPVLEQARLEVGALFTAGILEPVPAADLPPGWARVGVRDPSSVELARRLLDAAPHDAPQDLAGWCAVAEWWGDLRRLVASAPLDLREAAWEIWYSLDAAFVAWLRGSYGPLLSSAARWPVAVHRIGRLLARRLREGAAERVMLIVLDGLGHSQWAHLRERLELEVVEAGSTMALIPTYTTISRQAIFAGDLPAAWPDTLWTTHPERKRWTEFWSGEGVPVTGVAYHRVKGRLPHDRLGLGDAQAIGVVVNAVDDLMHSSELFGDAQLLANLDVWAANGFLVDLVARANAEHIETWITADHGNLECIGSGSISEGVAIEAAGKRLLRYPNQILRDASAAEGVVWEDIPGMPSTAEPLLFASGRNAFTNNRVSVSHGGLSLDEVIVPLARVTV
jgi:hypothetical protein